MKRQERKNDSTINIYKILTIVLAVVLIVVLIIFGRSWMVQKNAQKEYEKLSAQVNDLQNQVNDNQINIPSDTQTETENVAQEVQTEDSELEQKGIEIPQKNLNWKKLKEVTIEHLILFAKKVLLFLINPFLWPVQHYGLLKIFLAYQEYSAALRKPNMRNDKADQFYLNYWQIGSD